MPTRLLPAPIPWISSGATRCTALRSNFGSTVSAKRIFRVEAGASRRCGLLAASTSPDAASATIQDCPVRSPGSAGAPASGSTWTPGSPSRSPPTEADGGDPGGAATATGAANRSGRAAAGAAIRRASFELVGTS